MDLTVSNTIKNLEKKGYNVSFYENTYKAKEEILKKIDKNEDVGIGGSMTIFDMNIHNELIDRGNNVYWHWLVDAENRNNIREKARNSFVYLSSSNAITEDGKLVNVDGLGNRVSSIIYGHSRVYIICGINKIVKNLEKAMDRIKKISCPQNAKRLDLNTPCRYDECLECKSEDRMCNITVIIENKPMNSNINIILINDDLGY